MTLHEACRQLAELIDGRTRGIWVMVADRTAFEGMKGNAIRLAHSTALQFLFERVSGNPAFRDSADRSWVVVADHVSSREVGELTRFLKEFSNPFTEATLPAWIDPHALAGASEDWAGIQIADVIAYLAAHYRAKESGVGGDEVAASAFKTMFWDKLAKKAGGRVRGIGYKTW